jgi:hypothetical protein
MIIIVSTGIVTLYSGDHLSQPPLGIRLYRLKLIVILL